MTMNVSWLNVDDVCTMGQNNTFTFRHEDLISTVWGV